MAIGNYLWSPELVCLQLPALDVHAIARFAYDRTCRTNFESPGFCLVDLGNVIGSIAFRQLMVDLKCEMANIHEQQTKQSLIYISATRFDQQQTTKLHLDGGPDECFLMLGYEPSDIQSELEIADYTRCAFDLGLSPQDFLAKHNPMFQAGHELLRPYTTRIPCFKPSNFQIVCINNSSAPISQNGTTWQGTLHTATIVTPDESKRRVINSTMIARAPLGSRDLIDEMTVGHFIQTSEVKRRGYDKLHLGDDA